MKKRLLSALLLLAVPLAAQTEPRAVKKTSAKARTALAKPAAAAPAAKPAAATQDKDKEPPKAPPWLNLDRLFQKNIKVGDIEVFTPVTGVTTAQDTYDIFAPFEGRVEDMQAELFEYVTPKTLIGRMVSTEMAALLDASTDEDRAQTERRWKDVYQYFKIQPEAAGVLTNIYVQPKTRVLRGDRLFTVARKVIMIGKNTEPLYSKLGKGMTAEIAHKRDPDSKYSTVLTDFVSLKGSPLFNRLWLEVTDMKGGIKIGEQFDGTLFVGRSGNAMLLPREELLEHGGRKFIITEIKTGLETREELEILEHTSVYLAPEPKARGEKDGKNKKSR
jgi:biotin carboxyl carrier protein